jgi:hypothetical protein
MSSRDVRIVCPRPYCPIAASASLYAMKVLHEVFVFRWIRMSPLFVRCLCFWLEIMGPAFISSLCAKGKYPFQFWCADFVVLENVCVIWWAQPWPIPSSKATLSVVTRRSSYVTRLRCEADLGGQHQLHLTPHSWTSSPTRTIVAAINKRLSVLHRHSCIISVGFTTSLLKKRITGMLFLWCMSVVKPSPLTAALTSTNQCCQLSYLQVTSTNTDLKHARITVPYTIYSHLCSLLKIFDCLPPSHPLV